MHIQSIFEQTLKNQNLSMTRPRQAVFNALQHHKGLTMSELVVDCPGVDRASVYRTVDVFERLGIITRIPNGWKYRLELGEAFHSHHHHATCRMCGGSIPLAADSALEAQLHEIARNQHFTLESHQIELSGTCASCAQ